MKYQYIDLSPRYGAYKSRFIGIKRWGPILIYRYIDSMKIGLFI